MSGRSDLEVGRAVLGYVLQTKLPNALDLLLRRVGESHFTDEGTRKVFLLVERYSGLTGAILSEVELSDLASRKDAGTALRLAEVYSACVSGAATSHDAFVFALEELRERRANFRTRETITTSAEMLRGSVTIDRVEWSGHADARQFLIEELSGIDSELSAADAPRGDVMVEESAILEDYLESKTARVQGRAPGCMTGISGIDRVIGSFAPGELVLIIGWTSDGKTTFCVNTAWDAAVMQGKNVYFATTETLRPTIRRRLACRHSAHPQFGLAEGLDSTDVKRGLLSDAEEATLRAVASDMAEGRKSGRYGFVEVAQVPRGATIAQVEAQALRFAASNHIDLLVVDYLGLLTAQRHRRETRDELSETLKYAKLLAATFADSTGVTVLSPWQVSRNARERAEATGRYGLSSLSETAEAEKSPDIIISQYRPTVDGGLYPRHDTVTCQVLKNRDGPKADDIAVSVDFASCAFSDAGNAPSTPYGDTSGLDEEDALSALGL